MKRQISQFITICLWIYGVIAMVYMFGFFGKQQQRLYVHNDTLFFNGTFSVIILFFILAVIIFGIALFLQNILNEEKDEREYTGKTVLGFFLFPFVVVVAGTVGLVIMALHSYIAFDKDLIRTHSFFGTYEKQYTWSAIDSAESYYYVEYDRESTHNTYREFEYGLSFKDGRYVPLMKEGYIAKIINFDRFLKEKNIPFETTIQYRDLSPLRSYWNVSSSQAKDIILATFYGEPEFGKEILSLGEHDTCGKVSESLGGTFTVVCEH